MAELSSHERHAGFQRSETSSAELVIYEQPTDPVLTLRNPEAGKRLHFDGRRILDDTPSLIDVTTSKELGAASGTWSAIVKQANPFNRQRDLRDLIADDAWVDIHFNRHNRRYFTMRGMVDSIRRSGSVSSAGATTVTYTLTGRDHGKVWELTPIWFNKYVDNNNPPENAAGAAAMRVFTSLGLGGAIPDIVRAYLQGFLEELAGFGRANWEFPNDMPGIGTDRSFIKNVSFDESGFTNDPPRIAVAPNFLDPSGANAWAMAQEWADPAFVEMFSDLSDTPNFNNASDQLTNESLGAQPTVILRDRPFPTLDLGDQSPWFSLPMVLLPREDVIDDDLGKNGNERFNAYFVSPQVLQEFMGSSAIEVTAPLWNKDDMLTHGFRRYDINSRYQLDIRQAGTSGIEDSLLTLTKLQRARVRDWYCLNPYFHNGTIECARGVLEARVGRRLRIPGISEDEDFTAYIESVGHNWRFGQGTRSTLGVTRGWYGTDDSYLSALQILAVRYGGNRQGDVVVPPSIGATA